MSRRAMVRRGIKKRGMLPSFGDMVLPIVSIAAVALLVIAGRQFFLNGLKSSPGISSTRAYAEAPALMAERGEIKSADAEMVLSLANVPVSAEISKEPKLTETRPEPQNDFLAIAVAVPQAQSTKTTISVATTSSQQAKKATTAKSTSNATVKKTAAATTTKASSLPANKQWRVQIGSYTSKSGAQEAANKINKAGYKATVYQNPASKHFKVWVQGGANKSSAEKVVNAMKKLGYKGSFSFPPAK